MHTHRPAKKKKLSEQITRLNSR